MKTTTTNKKTSAKKKLLPAAGSLLISAAMLGTSTYAWFTMNKEVQVTGMQMKTKVGSNLLISTTNLDADYTSKTLSQTRKALLEPTSTINGTTGSFFYTVDALANGDAVSDNYTLYNEDQTLANATAGKPKYDDNFNAAYKLGSGTAGTFANAAALAMTDSQDGAAYGYIDYTFYLKATSNGTASTTAQQLRMTECDLDYNDGALDNSGSVGKKDGPDRAWRIAVFVSDITVTKPGNGRVDADVAATADNQKGLLSLADAAYQTTTGGNQAVSSLSGLGTVVNKGTSGVILDTINTNNATKYYKVTVRLWLEGEDTTCTSETYATLTNKYSLDLAFELSDGNAGGIADKAAVTNITSDSFVPETSSGSTFTGDQYDSGS